MGNFVIFIQRVSQNCNRDVCCSSACSDCNSAGSGCVICSSSGSAVCGRIVYRDVFEEAVLSVTVKFVEAAFSFAAVASAMLIVGGLSSSTIVTTAWVSTIVPLDAEDMLTKMVSASSSNVSARIGMLIAFTVSPAAKVSVWLVAV